MKDLLVVFSSYLEIEIQTDLKNRKVKSEFSECAEVFSKVIFRTNENSGLWVHTVCIVGIIDVIQECIVIRFETHPDHNTAIRIEVVVFIFKEREVIRSTDTDNEVSPVGIIVSIIIKI